MFKISILILCILSSIQPNPFNLDPNRAGPVCVSNTTTLNCFDFDKLDELNLKDNSLKFKEILIQPSKKIILTETNLNKDLLDANYIAQFSNFDGFDLETNFFSNILKEGERLEIKNSNFRFLYKDQTNYVCSFEIAKSSNILFFPFSNIKLGLGLDYINDICPIIFKQKTFETLEITNLTVKNRLKFTDIQIPSGKSLDAAIKKLVITDSEITLDAKLVNDKVFNKLEYLEFSNKLISVEEEFFKSIQSIKRLEFNLDNMYQFVNNNKEMWFWFNPNVYIANLNKEKADENKNKQITFILRDNLNNYTFSDDNFCDFYNFPHERLVIPIIVRKTSTNCSCTLSFLGKNYNFYDIDPILKEQSIINNCINPVNANNCNFDDMIKYCKNPPVQSTSTEVTTTTILTTTTTETIITSDKSPSDETKLIFLILIILASILAIGLIVIFILIIVYLCRKIKKTNNKDRVKKDQSYLETPSKKEEIAEPVLNFQMSTLV